MKHAFRRGLSMGLAAILAAVSLTTAHAAPEDIVTIPDANLRACINQQLGQSDSADITEADMQSLDSLYCWSMGITDATGLQHATSLTTLALEGNQLTSVDLTGLTKLTGLDVYGNRLAGIDLTGLDKLSYLFLGGNQLTGIDLTGLANLTGLSLGGNQLTGVDLTGLDKLSYLSLDGNQLTGIDLTGLANLNHLFLDGNQLTGIDLTGLANLDSLSLDGNQLTGIDLTGLAKLNHLSLDGNQLTGIDLTGLHTPTYLSLDGNQLTGIDLTGLVTLDSLSLDGNQLTGIDLTGLANLDSLSLDGNQLTGIDLTGLANLDSLSLDGNQLTGIDLTGLATLYAVDLSNNQLASVDVRGLTNLSSLSLEGNRLGSLDVSGLTSLSRLIVADNQLAEWPVGVASLPSLYLLNLSRNELSDAAGGSWASLSALGLRGNHIRDFSPIPESMTQSYAALEGQVVELPGSSTGVPFVIPALVLIDGTEVDDVTAPAGCSYDSGAGEAVCAAAGEYTFTIEAGTTDQPYSVDYLVTITDGTASPFTDVDPGDPFFTEILWMAETGISTGYSDGTYRPADSVHRAAMAAFLYRAAGEPAHTAPSTSPFSDVKPGDPFYAEISWMAESGISTGYSDGTYKPADSVHRAAMAAFLYRAAGEPAYTAPVVSPFSDVKPGDPFYSEICWMAETGISTGYTDGTYRPADRIHRAAMAAFLYRLTNL
ncbi:S-layer homology domain-containing protein [Tessaracoccus sp. Y1736]